MASRPNILIFMTDQEQADVVAPGHPCPTPFADKLAAEGIRFTQAYTPAAHCCPSRATFMTGLYPSRHGVYNNVCTPTAIHYGLAEGVITFSELLAEAGYKLTLCGKWHVSVEEGPADRGWEEREVTGNKGTLHHRTIDQWRHGPLNPPDTLSDTPNNATRRRGHVQRPGWGDIALYRTLPDGGPKGYEALHDAKVVQSALDALGELTRQEKPWCLFVGPVGPHDPYNVPEKFVKKINPADVTLPASYADTLEDKPRIAQRQRRQIWDQLSEEEVRESIAHYWAYCNLEDALFGEVLDALEASGQADDTLVLFLSDHGDYLGAHGLYMKGVAAFREAYHIPCIMRWPKGIEASGRSVDAFITLADFAPTFLELAGVPVPEGLTGRSMVPFLQGETPDDWPDAVYSQFNGVELYYTQRIVATKSHKYVYNGFDFDELYDLENDPAEMVNVADRPEYQEIKQALVRKMWHFAAREQDMIFNAYGTVALAPWGPADSLAQETSA
jgi:arylsulfatase A-like enzyme